MTGWLLNIFIFSNGDRYEGDWKEDDFGGKGTYTYSSGDWYAGSYKNGKEDGLWKSYYENGQLESELIYKDGEIISTELYEYYDDQKLKSSTCLVLKGLILEEFSYLSLLASVFSCSSLS